MKLSPLLIFSALTLAPLPAWGLPPSEDIPEEILRTEIITEARSPLDGNLMTSGEYALLESKFRTNPPNPQVNPKVEELIYLIRLRKLFRSIGIPIK
jgi:hypothetical protein